VIIECPECGTKNQTSQPPQPNKRYRCGKCNAVISFPQTDNKQDILSEIPKEKIRAKIKDLWIQFRISDTKTRKRISLGFGAIAIIALIGLIIGLLTPSDTIDLKAFVKFDEDKFIIKNDDNFEWINIKFEINSGLSTGGYVFRASSMGHGGTYRVGASQFIKEDGERFNPSIHNVETFSIWCDTLKGNGFWIGEW